MRHVPQPDCFLLHFAGVGFRPEPGLSGTQPETAAGKLPIYKAFLLPTHLPYL